jgi:hypothetical protein
MLRFDWRRDKKFLDGSENLADVAVVLAVLELEGLGRAAIHRSCCAMVSPTVIPKISASSADEDCRKIVS